MNITPTELGYEHILVFTALQGAKEGIVKSEYSGTVRLADYRADAAFINKCITAWAGYALSLGLVDNPEATITSEDITPEDIEDIFTKMVVLGYFSFDSHHNLWEFTALNREFGYVITSEGNVPDWGILAWGVDGIGASYSSSDLSGVPFDAGVTEADYLDQFPQHNITGSDIILVLPGANAIPKMLEGWVPNLKELVENIRSRIPVPIPVN